VAKAKKTAKKAVIKVAKKASQPKKAVKTKNTKSKSALKTKTKLKIKTKSNHISKPKLKTQLKPKSKVRVTSKAQAKSQSQPKSKSQTKVIVSKQEKPKKLTFLDQVFVPLDDRVLVRVIEAARKTPGGLLLPDTMEAESSSRRAHVVSIGRGHRDDKGHFRPMDVKLGDVIVFTGYSGSSVDIFGESLIVLRESEIMGVVV